MVRLDPGQRQGKQEKRGRKKREKGRKRARKELGFIMTQHCLLMVIHGTSPTAAAAQPLLQVYSISFYIVALTNPFIYQTLYSLNCV